MPHDTKGHIRRVLNVGVPVSDHERALAFYGDVLGCELRLDATFGDSMRWVEVAPPGAETCIALMPAPQEAAAGVDTAIRLLTDDADATHAHLTASGVDVDAEILRWEGIPPMFTLRDPDGNTLYVVEED
jgi:predicted enzyme related to lactoylglutathione lyase